MRPMILRLTTCTALSLMALAAGAQQDFSKVTIETTKVAEGLYMLVGAGGNLGVSVGDDGVFLVDDQYAPLTDKIRTAIGAVSDQDIRFVVNTHWHGDHTGGNENLGSTGTVIVAHGNVRERMSTEQFLALWQQKVPPSPKAALPVITYEDAVTFHLNGQTIHAFHVPPAHTDGDSVVVFKELDVIHAGDLFFNGIYPFIDVASGGNIDGMIQAIEKVASMTGEKTKIIPGHGPLADKKALMAYHGMLVAVRDAVKPLVDEGKSRDEVIAANPTSALDEQWGQGFMKPDVFTGIVFDSLSTGK